MFDNNGNSGTITDNSVMIVDDSALIRSFLSRIITDAGIPIGSYAENGKQALEKLKSKKSRVIFLDIEMPEMDGISALPEIMKISPNSKVIMISTLTHKNAEMGMKALALGAVDYIEKPTTNTDRELFKEELLGKVRTFMEVADKKENKSQASEIIQPEKSLLHIENIRLLEKTYVKPEILAIGSSTGGPQALSRLFEGLRGHISGFPIFLTQHMPATFTSILAQNLNKVAAIPCVEGVDGDIVQPGKVYIAPGDYHMTVKREGVNIVIKLDQNPPVNFCRPAVDPMFRSLSEVYGNKVMAVILTGMGQDGLVGAEEIIKNGGQLIAQDMASSVVWGMPRAVAKAGICRGVYPLDDIARKIIDSFKGYN